jgi:hypothetical protein
LEAGTPEPMQLAWVPVFLSFKKLAHYFSFEA